MLENNNLRICRRLVRRDLKFHKVRYFFWIVSFVLVTGLYSFTFLLTNSIEKEVRLDFENSYGSGSQETGMEGVGSFYLFSVLVAICGFYMIYKIIHNSVEYNIRYWGQLKSLGMTCRQIRHVFLEQVTLFCVIGLLPGWLLGFLLHYIITPRLAVGIDQYFIIHYFSVWPLVISSIITWLTALAAYVLPAYFVGKISSSEAMKYYDVKAVAKRGRNKKRRITVVMLALISLKQRKWRTVLSGLCVLAATLLLCSAWINTISYDEEMYLDTKSPWDYTIADRSVNDLRQSYNQENHFLTDEMAEDIKSQSGIVKAGVLKTREVTLKASDLLIETVSKFYNFSKNDEIARRDLMADEPEWCKGLARMEKTGEYIGILAGVDGLLLEKMVKDQSVIDGIYDAEAFQSGGYVITAGASSKEGLSSLPAGAKVTLCGREFTVMAAIYDSSYFMGGTSREAVFSIVYYLPLQVLEELFPNQGIRQMSLAIDHTQQKEFEAYLDRYEGKNPGIVVTKRIDHLKTFENQRMKRELPGIAVGITLLFICLINFINTLVTKILVRKREFAVYESLGMTDGQLKKLLFLKGLFHTGVLVVAILPATAWITWGFMPWIFTWMSSWCVTYRFSLAPLWIVLWLLLLVAVFAPLLCYHFLKRGNVAQRLQMEE